MRLRHTLHIAFRGLRANLSRSALTILGIVIGITAIIVVMAVGEGAEQLILDQVRGLGPRTIIIEPGRQPKGPSDFVEVFSDSLKSRDVEALQATANVRGLEALSPLVAHVVTIAYGTETKRTSIRGAAGLVAQILNLTVAEGSFFDDDDIRRRMSVAVIGSQVKEELFGLADAVGQPVKIKGRTFRVVGVLQEKGAGIIDVDQMAFLPYTTVQDYLLGISHYHAIIAQAETEALVPRVARDIELTLRESHGITDPEKDDFHVTTQADAMRSIGMISTILTALLTSVAAISLVVGGIGIMNIMLVAVTERTREIGLRKAVGATEADILRQFLLESIMLTGTGGLVGIALGALLSGVAALVLRYAVGLPWGFALPVSAVLLGVGVSTLVGVVFGLYPAMLAARKNPIEALRYE